VSQNPAMLMCIDAGTTHCKAALIDLKGQQIHFASSPTTIRQDALGFSFFDPEEFWAMIRKVVNEVTTRVDPATVAAIGISSMAETGLLIDRTSGKPRSPLIPWFDPSAEPYVQTLKSKGDPYRNFRSKGIYPSFKCSVAKLLWLRDTLNISLQDSVWLSAADYLAYRMCGAFTTDPSLAGRTYAFDIDQRAWNQDWLAQFNLTSELFPVIHPSGVPAGELSSTAASQLGLTAGIPIAVCGHDHVCGALAAVGGDDQTLFDSMGTAEALLGVYDSRPLDIAEFSSGFSFGCHVVPGMNYWMGGLSSAGGSIEWLRSILGDPPLTYDQMDQLFAALSPEPGDLLYFPYLAGSGAPHTDTLARGAFIGLNARHKRTDLAKAVLEGIAFEVEFIRQAAVEFTGHTISQTIAAGGGTRNSTWMQIKADVAGVPIQVCENLETTLLGTAILAAAGCSLHPDLTTAHAAMRSKIAFIYQPNQQRHLKYERIYENGYLRLQSPLREFYRYTLMEGQYDTKTL
jgi:sugar (pentulose or hexulose) kinase